MWAGQRTGHNLRTRWMSKIRSSVNKVSWLLLIMSVLEWDIRLSFFHSILFGLGLQAWRFLRTSIMNLHEKSFYVPSMRWSALWDHPKVLSSRDIAFFISSFNLYFCCWTLSKTCTVSFRIHQVTFLWSYLIADWLGCLRRWQFFVKLSAVGVITRSCSL